MPTEFEFSGVHPNPFNSAASLAYGLPEPSEVAFTVYDVQGRKIRNINCGLMPSGYHSITWDAADGAGNPVASGDYFVKMAAAGRKFTRRAVMLK